MGPGLVRLLSGHCSPRLAGFRSRCAGPADMSTPGHEVGRKQGSGRPGQRGRIIAVVGITPAAHRGEQARLSQMLAEGD
jgi:hypothetical protein